MKRNIEKLINEGRRIEQDGGQLTALSLEELKDLVGTGSSTMVSCYNSFLAGMAIGSRLERKRATRVQ